MPKQCPKCNASHNKPGKFCSRTCANSRGPRTQEFKDKVSKKLTGRVQTEEAILKRLATKGLKPISTKPNTICTVCSNDTGTKHRKTCSIECRNEHLRIASQRHPKCGGQKHTHRSTITNIKGVEAVAESSFEVRLASILNEMGVLWERPSYFWYNDTKNRKRRYYPDFFLPDYDVYLDPKNDYLIKTDIEKIQRASKQNGIFVVVIGDAYINEVSMRVMVGNNGTAPLHPACKAGVLLLN